MSKGTITVRYTRSAIGRKQDQRDTIRGLGFKRLNDVRTLPNTPEVRGMIKKVIHMVTVEAES